MFGKFGQNAAPASAVSGLHHGEHEERKENKTIQIIINFVLLILLCKIHSLNFCEAQGKGRAKGRPRKVTKRSFIDMDGGWWLSFP